MAGLGAQGTWGYSVCGKAIPGTDSYPTWGIWEAYRMYQFSRSIYRELAPDVIEDPRQGICSNRLKVLQECEAAMERLATDRHYFARPARSLFRAVRFYFPISLQVRVYRVIEHHMRLAAEFVERHEREGLSLDGKPLSCHASTRKGTPCQREPLPGNKYCPSHKHLEEDFVTAA